MSKITTLKYCKKGDLQGYVEVLEVEIAEHDKIAKIIQKIAAADDYDEDIALNKLGT